MRQYGEPMFRCRDHIARAVMATAVLAQSHSARAVTPPESTPPEALERVAAELPATVTLSSPVTVWLKANVDAAGRVVAVEVVESGGDMLDSAAEAALRRWRFRPATLKGKPMPSLVKVPFFFARTSELVARRPVEDGAPRSVERAAPEGLPSGNDEGVIDVTIRGVRRPPPRATSDYVLDRGMFTTIPRHSAADVLESAPGLTVSRPEGDAVAHAVTLRGFDAEHGQDLEFTLNGVPINLPSHIHGQGYADLNFIIPETIRQVRVTEGVFDPRQGDFAVAGTVDFDLGVSERGVRLGSSYGAYNTFRQLVLWAPEREADDTFGAVVFRRSDGFGQNRGSLASSAFAQYGFDTAGGFRGVVHLAGHGARANLAGVLRRDDVAAGRVGFLDSYDQPTATGQNALSSRAQVGVTLERAAHDGSRVGFGFWLLFSTFRGQSNYTGYTRRSVDTPEWVGRGDLLGQEHRDVALGGRFSYRTRRFEPASWAQGTFEVGLTFRTDFIEQAENVLLAPQNEIWDRSVDAASRSGDIGLYGDLDWRLSKYFVLRGGLRVDGLFFDVDDKLGNRPGAFAKATHLPGFARSAFGIAWGPRVSVEAKPLRWLDATIAYGEGYRSPQARTLEEGESAPFAKVRGLDAGLRFRPLGDDRLVLSAAAFATWLSTDLAFDPSTGTAERIGPTRRVGAVLTSQWRPVRWALLAASVTYVDATLTEPPPATPENPTPPFVSGQRLPYVPPVVLRVDASVDGPLWRMGGHPVIGRLGVGLSYRAPRPLPFGQSGDHIALLDVSVSLRWRWLTLGADLQNVADQRYATAEYTYASTWQPGQAPSLLPARHTAAGAPFTWAVSLGIAL